MLRRVVTDAPTTFLQKLATPFMPPIETARHYSWLKLRRDLFAGLTVSVVEVPQSMAYAMIAGVPPQYGLYTSIIQGIIGALLSSSEHVTTGPTNTQSLLIASTVARLAGADQGQYLQLVFALTMLKGVIQLAFAAANLGDVVRYVSRSVIVGVTAGAGVLILAGQLPNLIGVTVHRGPDDWPGVVGALQRVAPHFGEVKLAALVIGVGVIVLVIGIRAINKLLPGAFVAMIFSGVAVAVLHWTNGQLPLIGELPRGVPTFGVPTQAWKSFNALIGGALALALLGSLESVAIAKAIASRSGERINANQEFFTQGLKNFVTSFVQCIPGSVSFTRSALDYAAGAMTRFAAVFNGVFVAAIFWLFAHQAKYIPLASLAGVLIVIAVGLIDWRFFLRTARTSRSDAIVCGVSFVATMFAPLEYAIFIGIFINIALYLRRASQLQMTEIIPMEDATGFEEFPLHARSGARDVLMLQVEGQLFFGIADELEDRLTRLNGSGVKVFIFRLKRTHSIDSTVLGVLERFTRGVQARGGYVLLCGLNHDLIRVVRAYGLYDLVGGENVFETGGGLFSGARRALLRAKELLGHSVDDSELRDIDSEALTYEI